jgi:ribonuclease HII
MLGNAPAVIECERLVAGIDEVGRGPLAGPVVAAAVVLVGAVPEGLADSKQLSHPRRAALALTIRHRCAFGLGVVCPRTIDRVNIFAATMLAMTQAMRRLALALHERGRETGQVLVDGGHTPEGRVPGWRWPACAVVGGDASEPAISAASVLAKEYRDALMREAASRHRFYGWERNKGYGTPEHLEALRVHGPSPLHRRSFSPVARSL